MAGLFKQKAHHFVHVAVFTNGKGYLLVGIINPVAVGIGHTAREQLGAARAARIAPQARRLLSGQNNARIGNSQTRNGHATQIFRIAHRVRGLHIAARRTTHAVQAQGAAASIVGPQQMRLLVHHPKQIVLPRPKAQHQAAAHIGHTRLKGHVCRVEARVIIALGPRNVGCAIAGLVVGVLINEHCAHIRIKQSRVFVRFKSAHVDIDAVHLAYAVKGRVQNAYGLGQIFNIRIGQLPAHKKYTLVPLADKLERGLTHFRRGHVFALNGLVAFAIGAVQALTAAVV